MRLIILDAHALIHRAYHALPPLTRGGEATNAIFGFFSSFIKMVGDLKPDYLVAAFDTPGKTFRHKEFKDYKAHRPKAPEDLIKQIIRIREITEAIGIYALEKPGYEADDVIGTITSQLKGKRQNEKGKITRQSSKVNKFVSLEIKENALNELEIIIVTGDYDTLQLVRDGVKVYAMKRGLSDIVIYDTKAVKKRFLLEPFQLSDYKGFVGDPSDNIPGAKGIGEKSAVALLQQFGNIEHIYENLNEVSNPTLRKKIGEHKEEAIFSKELATINCDVPLKFDLEKARWKGLPLDRVEPIFRALGFQTLLRRLGHEEKANSAQASLFGGNTIQAQAPSLPPEEEKKRRVALWLLDPSEKDARERESLPVLQDHLKKEGLLDVFLKIEVPLITVLEKMEANGISVDKKALILLEADLGKELRSLKQEITRLAGEEFNPNSSDQLRYFLFETLHLSPKGLKKTPGGKVSTRESELLKIADQHEFLPIILRYRELEKLLTTYATPLLQKIEKDGRIRTSFNQTGTSTGRLSSQNPNLQNIPVEGQWAKRVKNIFVAGKGSVLASFDYSQIELRVAAHLAGDEDLIAAFRRGEDIHSHTAAEVFHLPTKDVTPAMRRMAKIFNFGILYGLSAHGLAESLHVSREEAQSFIDGYFGRFKGVKRYIDDVKKEVAAKGYAQTLSGRKRWFPALREGPGLSWRQREALLREAVNMPIQGSTADIVKRAMIDVDAKILKDASGKDRPGIRLLLQIHDDLLFEIRENLADSLVPQIRAIMENAVKLNVPLIVEVKIGKRWGEMEQVKS